MGQMVLQVFLMLACESAVGIELSKFRHSAALALKKVYIQVLRRARLSEESLTMIADRVEFVCNDFVGETNRIKNSTMIVFNNLKGFDDYDPRRKGI